MKGQAIFIRKQIASLPFWRHIALMDSGEHWLSLFISVYKHQSVLLLPV